MNLFLFISLLIVSFIVVRIGAIAFQLTGLEWSVAKFQALSCFTATGFTTKEAELITTDKQRRRIASVLIVLGHAGLVTMIATLANSLRAQKIIQQKLEKPFLPSIPPAIVPLVNLLIIVVAVYVVYRLFTNTKFARKLTNSLRKRIIKKEILRQVSFEEFILATEGYGVAKINLGPESPILNQTLSESQLRSHDITVLAITKSGKTTANPSANTKLLLEDELLCFGKLDNIKSTICPAA